MNIRFPLIVSGLLIAAMLALSLWAWTALPPDGLVPVHFNLDGKVDRWAGKSFGLLLMPVAALAITTLLAFLPRIEPRRLNLARSAKFYRAVWIGIVAVLTAAHGLLVATALHAHPDAGLVVIGSIAAFFILIGNFLGKTRSNFFAGVRTPWTLSSEYSWERTHRLCGKLFMITGAATIAALIVLTAKLAMFILLAFSLTAFGVSVIMSYVYWRNDPERSSGNGATR